METLTKEEFINQLRDDLSHLYNLERLRQSPLSALFGVAKRFDTASALQRILIEAVNSLEPSPDEPHHSPGWQIYEPLYYRFVEQLSPEEVADQMALSVRHMRRKQQIALEALADVLWRQYDLKGITVKGDDAGSPEEHEETGDSVVIEELGWLKETASSSSADFNESFDAVLNLAQKLSDRYGVRLDIELANTFPKLAVDPIALRHIILNLLNVAIPRAAGGNVQISARPLAWEVEIHIQCQEYPSGQKAALSEESTDLNIAQSLADLAGCKLNLSVNARSFDVVLSVPGLEQLPVLVIDDNLDTLHMLSRYASGTRYHLITLSDPEQATKIAEMSHPRAIVLDVMMPHVDGWELFQRFRQNPATADIPIIVCTILGQKELAMLLGANDFLRKPISRETFLGALNQCVG